MDRSLYKALKKSKGKLEYQLPKKLYEGYSKAYQNKLSKELVNAYEELITLRKMNVKVEWHNGFCYVSKVLNIDENLFNEYLKEKEKEKKLENVITTTESVKY